MSNANEPLTTEQIVAILRGRDSLEGADPYYKLAADRLEQLQAELDKWRCPFCGLNLAAQEARK